MRMPEALIKPDTTGWLRKLAMKPRRSMAIAASSTPDSSARSMAAPTYSGLPAGNNGARLAAVISDTTATGPTASVRLEPNRA